MRGWTVVLSTIAGMAMIAAPAVASAAPAQPDLRGYNAVAPEDYFAGGGVGLYFQTPDGLTCGILPGRGSVGCDGAIPGLPVSATEVVLTAEGDARGFHQTSNLQYVPPGGDTPKVLPVGHKIAYLDFECAVGTGSVTTCMKGSPPAHWFVLSQEGSAIGPRTEGLPDNFPDPNDFVVGPQDYIVGTGAKNLFPVFTVGDGLTCKIALFSGGEIGCDGELPGVTDGANEIFVQLPGDTGIRTTDNPKYSTPQYPGPVLQLPAHHRVSKMGGTCMATAEGGVACFGKVTDTAEGFVASPAGTWTFGG